MFVLRISILFLAIWTYIVGGIILHLGISLIGRIPRWHILSLWTKTCNQLIRKIFKIKVIIQGDSSVFREKGNFVISNHLSYLDGVVLGSLMPLVYVSKSEVISWPLFGWMTQVAGTIFIDRKRRLKSVRYVQDIAERLKEKINVLVFPEGTSTNGEGILPFQSVFFEAPIIYGANILPLTIYYTKVNGESLSVLNRDKVFWYGQIKMTRHILQAIKLKNIEVEVIVHPKINAISHPADATFRKSLSNSLRQTILKAYSPIKKESFNG